MTGPARAGGLLYAKNLEQITGFYESILAMERLHADDQHVVLASEDFQLIVHAIPAHVAKHITITIPPEHRETTPIKLFFTVSSIQDARETANALGGEVFEQSWDGPGFVVCNACDPEGNIFQVRENFESS
ncbi:MAG: VOC family protein [Lysobacterales bacterium]